MPEGSLNYHLNTLVTEIDSTEKNVKTSSGETVPYDILILATGSDALLPRQVDHPRPALQQGDVGPQALQCFT